YSAHLQHAACPVRARHVGDPQRTVDHAHPDLPAGHETEEQDHRISLVGQRTSEKTQTPSQTTANTSGEKSRYHSEEMAPKARRSGRARCWAAAVSRMAKRGSPGWRRCTSAILICHTSWNNEVRPMEN